MLRLLLSAVVLLLVASPDGVFAAGPKPKPKPKKVKCQNRNYPACWHKDLYCPETCARDCLVDCSSCQPVCPPSPPIPPKKVSKVKCQDKNYKKTCNKNLLCPDACPSTCVADCVSCRAICPTSPPPPPVVTPSPYPPPPVVDPSPPPPPPPVVTPSPPPVVAGVKRVRCRNKNYPSCYLVEHQCPDACPETCQADCNTCSPVCSCDRPGAVCEDPKFVGADGITFYFHGKKEKDFCIVSDTNLHINAHFIGRRNRNMARDFTWVQSLGILFDNHQLFIGAKKTATWDDAVDRLEVSFDGSAVLLAEREGTIWKPESAPDVSFTRSRDTNALIIEVEGNFQIRAAVVPITKKDSMIHNYGITEEDCFAHLDLGFKFYSLSSEVNGVLFTTDCAIARFKGTQPSTSNNFQYANLNCASGIDGRGVVCRK